MQGRKLGSGEEILPYKLIQYPYSHPHNGGLSVTVRAGWPVSAISEKRLVQRNDLYEEQKLGDRQPLQ